MRCSAHENDVQAVGSESPYATIRTECRGYSSPMLCLRLSSGETSRNQGLQQSRIEESIITAFSSQRERRGYHWRRWSEQRLQRTCAGSLSLRSGRLKIRQSRKKKKKNMKIDNGNALCIYTGSHIYLIVERSVTSTLYTIHPSLFTHECLRR